MAETACVASGQHTLRMDQHGVVDSAVKAGCVAQPRTRFGFWVKSADWGCSRDRVRRLGATHPTIGSVWVGNVFQTAFCAHAVWVLGEMRGFVIRQGMRASLGRRHTLPQRHRPSESAASAQPKTCLRIFRRPFVLIGQTVCAAWQGTCVVFRLCWSWFWLRRSCVFRRPVAG